MRCPRRDEIGSDMSMFNFPKTDKFTRGKCSWCGSISPVALFEAIHNGCEIVPTDKSYKIYIEGEKAPDVSGACKFYFQHFNKEEKLAFIELLNDGKINMAYPGYFYVMPFFCKPAEKAHV